MLLGLGRPFLYGGLGISILQFLIKKLYKKFVCYKFIKFLVIKTLAGSGLIFTLKCWIRNQWIRIRNTDWNYFLVPQTIS